MAEKRGIMQNNSFELGSIKDDSFNFRETLNKYIYHWKWFLFSIFITLIFSGIYLLITPKKYQVASAILITELDEGQTSTESSAFGDLGLFDGPKNSLDTEISILKSIKLLKEVVKELDLNISYQRKEYGLMKEIYSQEVPFKFNLSIKDSILEQLSYQFSMIALSKSKFTLFDNEGNLLINGSFGEKVSIEHGDVIVTPRLSENIILNRKILINISPLEDVAMNLQSRIKITPETRNSNLLLLTLIDPFKLRAQSILNTLVIHYNKDAIHYKNSIASSTDDFLNKRIADISLELTGFDRGVETYKKRNKLSDINSEEGIVLTSNAGIGNQIIQLTSQIKLIDYISEYIKTNKNNLIPQNLGLQDANFRETIVNYNNFLLEKNNLLKSASEQNPLVQGLENKLNQLRISIKQSMLNTRKSLTFSLEEAKREESKLASKIASSPRVEREIKDIQRQQEIVETLYLYLLEKKEENSISLAITAPNAKVIDTAYGRNVPVSPRKLMVLFVGLTLGIVFPFGFIFLQSLFDNKIHIQEDIEDVIGGTILGDIPISSTSDKLISFELKNNLTESFRLLRTNVDYVLGNSPAGKIIFVSSTIAGEGKTFIAINLAKAFSLIGKKVLLIGADIRKPKIEEYINTKQEKGLTDFLIDRSLELSKIIISYKKTNIDILAASRTPINPSELLINDRFEEVMKYGNNNYDYVIVDTAPINLATDTLLISHHADLFIYIIRANHLNKRLLKIPKKMFDNKRLPNMTFLLNGVNYEKEGYSGSYGYGEEYSNKLWFQKLF
ncbi:GumC family protein [Maribacter sp. CXY002]|uniref:GumC family protein n=1 Tax=Maribacter luteocoastalis TaxID=3407671 RepID=UPI003B67DB09